MSFGQSELAFRNYNLESGLPSNTIYESFQDKQGYIYIGHNNGCSIFNGLSFQSPTCAIKTSALSNFISFENGHIMCRNFQGKQFILKNNKLTPFQSSLKESWGFPAYIEDGNEHFIFQSGSLHSLDKDGKGEEVQISPKFNRIFHGVVLKGKLYLFGSIKTYSVLICYDLKLKKTIASKRFMESSNVHVYKGAKNIFWMDDRSGECGTYDNGFKSFGSLHDSALPKDSKITGFVELDGGEKLISTFNGVYRLNKDWKFTHHYLDGIQCTHLLSDKNKGLWVSSLQNGLFYVPNTDVVQINSASFEGRNVKFSKVYTSNNHLYVGTYDGRILKFSEQGKLIKVYDFNRNVEIQSMHISGNTLYAYCGGFLKIDESSGQVLEEKALSACKSIQSVGEQLICGSSKGLIIIKKDEIRTFLDTLWIKNALPFSANEYLLESAENVYLFNLKTQNLKLIQEGGTNSCVLGKHWYFRTSNFIYSFDKQLKKSKVFSTRIPISHLYVTEGKLTVDLKDHRSVELFGSDFKKQRKLTSSVMNDITFAGGIGNYRIIGNSSSIQLIPITATKDTVIPTVSRIDDSGNFTLENNAYSLPYKDNELTFQFDVLPNFHYSGEGNVYYRIVELNGEWKPAQKKEHYSVELLRIPPGKFTLEVYAESGGVHSEIQQFNLKVKQPFYFQWWFILLFFGFIIGISYLIIRWRARLIELKNRRVFEKQQLKLKALNAELVAIRSQMNPHFIFNSLSSIQTKILNEDRVEAYKNVNTFATLLRQALHFTSKEFISLQEEMEFTRNYVSLEQTRTENAFEYVEVIDPLLDLSGNAIPALFLQPFVENAIRHGLMHSKKSKLLSLTLTRKEDGFQAIIEDNGIGREASAAVNEVERPNHTSFASKAIQDRIDILGETQKMNIDLRIDDLENGTRVIIYFKGI